MRVVVCSGVIYSSEGVLISKRGTKKKFHICTNLIGTRNGFVVVVVCVAAERFSYFPVLSHQKTVFVCFFDMLNSFNDANFSPSVVKTECGCDGVVVISNLF